MTEPTHDTITTNTDADLTRLAGMLWRDVPDANRWLMKFGGLLRFVTVTDSNGARHLRWWDGPGPFATAEKMDDLAALPWKFVPPVRRIVQADGTRLVYGCDDNGEQTRRWRGPATKPAT